MQSEFSDESEESPQPSRARRLLHASGLDRAIVFTVLGRGWGVVAGPITIFFLANFLSQNELGYYYTFANILNLQVFFELGLAGVILQFASHEKAKLTWNSQGALEGDAESKARLASLLRLALGYYGAVAALVALVVLPAGLWFFGVNGTGATVFWRLPWLWLVLVTAGALLISPLYALLEGCGLVAQIATLRLCQTVAGTLLLWIALTAQWKLLAVPVGATFALFAGALWLWRGKRRFLRDLLGARDENIRVDWRGEIWPLQWKIALSWMTGYFTSNLFNPILFAFHGAAAAGRMGMSLSLATALWAMAFAWVSTKTAPFGFLVVQKDYAALDRLFFSCLKRAVSLAAFGAFTILALLFFLRHNSHPWSVRISARLLDPFPFALLLGATIISVIIAAQGLYLRSHKEEPFLGISLLSGTLMAISAYIMGRWHGPTEMMMGYFLIHILILKLSTDIFMAKRRLWHFVPPGQSPMLRARLERVRSNSVQWDAAPK